MSFYALIQTFAEGLFMATLFLAVSLMLKIILEDEDES
jgi:hypothetical protein